MQFPNTGRFKENYSRAYRCTSPHLSLVIKMRLYNPVIISITATAQPHGHSSKLSRNVFNTKAFHRIVGVHWYDHVTNTPILTRTGQPGRWKIAASRLATGVVLVWNNYYTTTLHPRIAPGVLIFTTSATFPRRRGVLILGYYFWDISCMCHNPCACLIDSDYL